jgi:hypothetical protein
MFVFLFLGVFLKYNGNFTNTGAGCGSVSVFIHSTNILSNLPYMPGMVLGGWRHKDEICTFKGLII